MSSPKNNNGPHLPDTIAAIATPPGIGGIGIVRVSGPRAVQISNLVLTKPCLPSPRLAQNVRLKITKEITDSAILIYFQAPHSFTGEDVIEIQTHGGLILERALAALLSHGARLANPGEFTRRALLNGKMNLSQAENLINLIHACTDAELAASTDTESNELHAALIDVQTALVDLSAAIFGALDHPDEIPAPDVSLPLHALTLRLSQFTNNARQTHFIYDGIRAVILGRPNVGKSSLFNSLIGSGRSIVTEIEGTTTDTVSETIQVNGFKVRLADTAGIRENPRDKIEKLGIERAIQAAKSCDVAIIFDDSAADFLIGKPVIRVTRESDPAKIKRQIIEKTVSRAPIRHVANTRQLNELTLARAALENAMAADGLDMIASDVQTALFHIGNITGTSVSEAVLSAIFSRFCLGK